MEKLMVGVGKREISVPTAHDPLYARALVINNCAIVALDAVAVGGIEDISDDFFPALKADLKMDALLVNASHTHTRGPMLRSNYGELIREAVAEARASQVPAVFGSASGHEDRFMINRTLRLKNGRGWTVRQANPCPPDDLVASLGPLDTEVGVIRFDRLDGTPLAVIYNYAGHPLIGVPDGNVTANYPGFASAAIEKVTGAMALFIQGAGGDVTEVDYKNTYGVCSAENNGRLLAESTLDAWRTICCRSTDFSYASGITYFPRRTDSDERIAELQNEQQELLHELRFCSLNFKSFLPLYVAALNSPEYSSGYSYNYLFSPDLKKRDESNRFNMDKYLKNIAIMERLARLEDRIATYRRHKKINQAENGEPALADLVAFRFGDCALVSTPVEMLTQIGLDLKARSPFARTYISAYSNGYMHYGCSKEDYQLGGYECTECFLAPEWRDIYDREALKLLNALK